MLRKLALYGGLGFAGLLVLFFVSLAVRSALARRPSNLGLVEGRLRPCPDTPNCVSSQASEGQHRIAPLEFSDPPEQAWARLQRVIENMRGVQIVTADEGYLHAEFTTLIMRFVDDVEFVLNAEAKTIDFRSASRVGHSDLGVNRRRMEAIRAAFAQ